MPVVLVGDFRLGGISTTIAALESLQMRGYDVFSIVLFETYPDNQKAIERTFLRHTAHSMLEMSSLSRQEVDRKLQMSTHRFVVEHKRFTALLTITLHIN